MRPTHRPETLKCHVTKTSIGDVVGVGLAVADNMNDRHK